MKENIIINDLTTGSVSKSLITFAFPLMLSNLLQTVYNMADMIVVGQFVGKVGLSAVSIGGNLLHLFTFIAIGFSNAGQVLISQYMGAGNKKEVSRTIGTIFTFVLSCAIAMTVICCIFAGQLLTFMNIPAEAYKFGLDYSITCYLGLFFIYGYNLVSAILRGMGDSKHPFMFIATAAATNLVLDLLFIAVFKWEVLGAALATVIGQGVSFVWAIIFLYKRREEFWFDFKPASFKIDKGILERGILFPKVIFGMFNSEEEVLEMAMSFIPCAVMLYLGSALRSPFMALINGSGQAKFNLAVGILDGVISRIGLALLLGITFNWGIKGFWYGSAIAGFVPFLIGGVFFVSGKWKMKKLIIN